MAKELKKILVVGHSPSDFHLAKIQEILKENPDLTVVTSPGDVPDGSTSIPDFTPKPIIDVDTVTFQPKYFPPSKSKFHK